MILFNILKPDLSISWKRPMRTLKQFLASAAADLVVMAQQHRAIKVYMYALFAILWLLVFNWDEHIVRLNKEATWKEGQSQKLERMERVACKWLARNAAAPRWHKETPSRHPGNTGSYNY